MAEDEATSEANTAVLEPPEAIESRYDHAMEAVRVQDSPSPRCFGFGTLEARAGGFNPKIKTRTTPLPGVSRCLFAGGLRRRTCREPV